MKKLAYATLLVIAAVVLLAFFGFGNSKDVEPNANDNDFVIKISDNCRKTGIPFSDNSAFTLDKLLPQSQYNYPIYDHRYFILGYAPSHKQAAWVEWLLTKQRVVTKTTKRLDNFREDSSLAFCPSTLEDYKRSGYARGHICPSADMLWDVNANSETFLLSNMSPQVKEFNDGRWTELEIACRSWAIKNDSVLIISGPIFKNPKTTIGKGKVTVPSSYFKIVIDISFPKCKAIAFIMPNERLEKDIFNYATTIKDIENQTGLNFFPDYDKDDLIRRLETTIDTLLWK